MAKEVDLSLTALCLCNNASNVCTRPNSNTNWFQGWIFYLWALLLTRQTTTVALLKKCSCAPSTAALTMNWFLLTLSAIALFGERYASLCFHFLKLCIGEI
jgi:hypothetical protein